MENPEANHPRRNSASIMSFFLFAGWGMHSRHEPERVFRDLKRTLEQCKEHLQRIEAMLAKSTQDNDRRK